MIESNAIRLVVNLSISSVGKSFFADYFLMGGSRFDTPQPEAYLFGENSDLNLLNPKPVSVSTVHYAQYVLFISVTEKRRLKGLL